MSFFRSFLRLSVTLHKDGSFAKMGEVIMSDASGYSLKPDCDQPGELLGNRREWAHKEVKAMGIFRIVAEKHLMRPNLEGIRVISVIENIGEENATFVFYFECP